ncbi:PAS domain S-box protein [Maribacter cobaltidurans]|uniref:histidine kinase n=1 Tax=Maribacter cobaltidurans TaxID=1178778 RepID=A0A223V4A1_9FLAO|nr:PAS domain S-box protein [Maribacter cobaltidurans]ASV30255.1 hypothetical protein CJ263_08505 [Maribacter cobaltidurans]GGD77052.1 hypothetical protein GCM10011412_13540 [Maribacter cobaltidurans]
MMFKSSPFNKFRLSTPLLSGFLVFLLVFSLAYYVTYQRYLILKNSEEEEVRRTANRVEREMKGVLEQGFSSTQNLSFLVENYGVPEDFSKISKLILSTNKSVDALELVDSTGVITNVYPLEGNEVLGFNILTDSIGKPGALKTIEKGKYYISGPIDLKQGGSGFICRTPIYNQSKFAGFAAAVIKLSSLLSEIHLDTLENNPFSYQLSKANPDGSEKIFFSSTRAFPGNSLKNSISDYNGEWKLHVISNKNPSKYGLYVLGGLGFFIAMLSGFFTKFMLEQPKKLKEKVEQKTLLLKENEQKLRTFIEQASDGIFITDFDGNILEANLQGVEMFGYPKKDLLQKNLSDLTTEQDLTKVPLKFMELKSGQAVLTERELLRKDTSSFYGEVSAKKLTNGTIMGIVRDVTIRKELQRAALDNLQKFKKAFNSKTIGMAIFDEQLNFVDANFYFLEKLGIGKDFRGKSLETLVNKIVGGKAKREEALKALEKHGKVLSMNLIVHTKDKRKIHFSTAAETYEVDDKKYILATYLDITKEKKAQEQIISSEKKYRELTERISDAFISVDTHWNLTYVNAKAKEFIKNPQHELTGKNLWETFPELLGSQVKLELESALKKQKDVHLEHFHPKDNVWIESHAYPSPEGLTVYFRDISMKKHTEQENQKLLTVVEKSPGFIGLSGLDGKSIYLNEYGRELVGLSAEDSIAPLSLLDFFPENAQEIIRDEYLPIIFKSGIWSGEGYLKHFKTNKNIPALLSAFIINDKSTNKPIGIGSVAFDLTEQKKTEREILDLQNKMDAAIRIGKIGYWNWNLKTDIIDWSDRMYEIYDVKPGKKIDASFSKTLVHPDDLEMHDAIIENKISNRDNSSFSYRIVHRDKSIKYVRVQMEVTTDVHGNPVTYQGTAVDITETKMFEERLEKQNAELIKTNSELDRFVYSASHELRAPLSSLLGLLNIMKIDEKREVVVERLVMMENSIMRLDGFIGDIIAYSRNKHLDLKKEEVNFNILIEKVLEDLWYLKNTNKISISTKIDTGSKFYSDSKSISVLLNNFLSNAIKYYDPKKSAPYIRINVETTRENAVVEIKDNGIGIKKKSHEKIYDMFYRDSTSEMGSGIGLFIVKEIMEKLGGTIALESKPGIGSTFILTLPNYYSKD